MFFQPKPRRKKSAANPMKVKHVRRLGIEALEKREVFAIDGAAAGSSPEVWWNGPDGAGDYVVQGTLGADSITISRDAQTRLIRFTGNNLNHSVPESKVQSITIDGYAGNDMLHNSMVPASNFSPPMVTLRGGSGIDTITSTNVGDRLYADSADETSGTAGDTINGSKQVRQLVWDSGTLTVIGSTGRDVIGVGTSNGRFYLSSSATDLSANVNLVGSGLWSIPSRVVIKTLGGDDIVQNYGSALLTVFGGSGIDTITSTNVGDRLYADSADETSGTAGDTINGSKQVRQLVWDSGTLTVIGSTGRDVIGVGTSNGRFYLSSSATDLSANVNLVGSGLWSIPSRVVIKTLGGDDIVQNYGSALLTVFGGAGIDTIMSTNVGDRLYADSADETSGTAGDTINGSKQVRQLVWDSGTLTVIGSTGRDVIGVGTSNGRFYLSSSATDLSANVNLVGSGLWTIPSRVVIKTLGGDDIVQNYGSALLTVFGGAGIDVIKSNNVNDALYGEAGDDTLNGYSIIDGWWWSNGSLQVQGSGQTFAGIDANGRLATILINAAGETFAFNASGSVRLGKLPHSGGVQQWFTGLDESGRFVNQAILNDGRAGIFVNGSWLQTDSQNIDRLYSGIDALGRPATIVVVGSGEIYARNGQGQTRLGMNRDLVLVGVKQWFTGLDESGRLLNHVVLNDGRAGVFANGTWSQTDSRNISRLYTGVDAQGRPATIVTLTTGEAYSRNVNGQTRLTDNIASLAANGYGVVRSLVIDNAGEMHYLQNDGQLVQSGGRVTSAVLSLARASDGQLYHLRADGVLYRYDLPSAAWKAFSGSDVVDFRVGPGGNVYALNTGLTLFRHNGLATDPRGAGHNWVPISGSDVTSFNIGNDGTLYALNTGRTVFRYKGPGSDPRGPGYDWTPISGSDVSSFHIARDGGIYAITTNRWVFRYKGAVADPRGPGYDWLAISREAVGAFAIGPAGDVYFAESSGDLWRIGVDRVAVLIGAKTRAWSFDNQGRLLRLETTGGLYRSTGAQSVLLESNVSAYRLVSADTVVAIRGDGGLTHVLPNGGTTRIANRIRQYSAAEDGTTVALQEDGLLVRIARTGGTQTITTNVESFTALKDGSIVVLGRGKEVLRWSPSVALTSLMRDVASHTVLPDGTVIALQDDGDLGRFTPGQSGYEQATQVTAYTALPDGTVIAKQSTGNLLRLMANGTKQTLMAAVASHAILPDGTVIALQDDGDLGRFAPGQSGYEQATQVTAFDALPDGTVIAKQSTGNLLRLLANGTKQTLMASVASYSILSDGTVIALQDDGDLGRFAPGQGGYEQATQVANFTALPNGIVIAKQSTGNLLRLLPNGAKQTLMTNTASYTSLPDGTVIALQDSGDLARFHAQGGSDLLGRSYRTFQVALNGTVVALQVNGDLARFHPQGGSDLLGRGYRSFQLALDGTVVAQHQNYDLARFRPDGRSDLLGREYSAYWVLPNATVIALQFSRDLVRFQPTGNSEVLGRSVQNLHFTSAGTLVWESLLNGKLVIANDAGAQTVMPETVKEVKNDEHGQAVAWMENGNLYRVNLNGEATLIARDVEDLYYDQSGRLIWDIDGGFFDDLGDIARGAAGIIVEAGKSILAVLPASMGGPLGYLAARETFGPAYKDYFIAGSAMAAATGAAVLTGGALAPEGAALWSSITVGAASGAAGSAASQAVLILGDLQSGFDWQQILIGSLTGAAGGALRFGMDYVSGEFDMIGGRLYRLQTYATLAQYNAAVHLAIQHGLVGASWGFGVGVAVCAVVRNPVGCLSIIITTVGGAACNLTVDDWFAIYKNFSPGVTR